MPEGTGSDCALGVDGRTDLWRECVFDRQNDDGSRFIFNGKVVVDGKGFGNDETFQVERLSDKVFLQGRRKFGSSCQSRQNERGNEHN